ncbi:MULTISPECIES: Lrp/AsnC family transcriptional regulator [Thalassolituus]|uniref:Lrp/AsnC family transcriptional regulator n=1 Tax=Thalassolituus TaxID=187492 RepID=UPI001B79ECF9|nr:MULTISPECIES: Lrp/AsnC ligand binding domain-containing protein [Thalassolituus]MBQ0725955.1 Lrp/AsnC ligand binding domain-containing protein [Thalassolituus oleivorans]MBQ0782223.1 Lrp/AsnC ligand binding domain-containing protein [Thalassolituus oleivorans]MDF1642334.1 Lrp/AsnC ligand binding domain-containing protein [Thalassolituus oleivorans]
MENLDKLDMSILHELQKDGRITVTELASRVGLSKTPCQIRMKRLEDQGFILGYVALLDLKKIGTRHVAFVQVSLSDTKTRALNAFNEAVRQIPEVEQCHMIAANFDYLLKVRTSDMESYRAVLGEKISALPYVTQTSTFVVMEDVKDIESRLG